MSCQQGSVAGVAEIHIVMSVEASSSIAMEHVLQQQASVSKSGRKPVVQRAWRHAIDVAVCRWGLSRSFH